MQKNTVYHYTSLETLAKIINDVSEDHLRLRATHIDFLNDYTEHTIAIHLLKDKLIEYDNSLSEDYSKKFQSLLNDKRMSFFKWEEIHDLFPFIISFSENWDSLPMWNTYGNKSQGIALGFDKNKLGLIESCKFQKCIYGSKEYEKYLDQNIKKIHSCVEVDSCSINFGSFDSNLLDKHYEFLPILKDGSYSYEKEHRLIVQSKIEDIERIKFQHSNNLLKPYLEVEVPFECLKEIVLGPTLNLEQLKTSLGILFTQKNKSISRYVEESKIYLRQSNCPFQNI